MNNKKSKNQQDQTINFPHGVRSTQGKGKTCDADVKVQEFSWINTSN